MKKAIVSLAAISFWTSAAMAQAPEQITIPAGTDPKLVQAFNEGGQLLATGQSAKAIEKLAPAAVALPNVPEVHAMYGAALVKAGRVDEGLVELEKAKKIKPDSQMILVNLGIGYQTAGRSKEALQQFERYLQVYPNGQHAANVKSFVQMLRTELGRTEGVESSKGKPDYLSEALALGAARWQSTSMPIKIYVADGKGVPGYRDEYAAAFKRAFEEWAAASNGKVRVEAVSDDSAPVNVTWTDNPKDLLNPSEGGQALVQPDVTGHINQVKIKLLTRLPNVAADNIAPYRHIYLHEAGHSLGLLGHSSDPGDIMFSSVSFETPRGELSSRDKATLVALYDAPESLLAQKKLELSKVGLQGEAGPLNEALKMSAKGLEQAGANNYRGAIESFEKARQLAPNMEAPLRNLALSYGMLANQEVVSKDWPNAEVHYKKSLELFQQLKLKPQQIQICQALISVARVRGNTAEAQKYEAILKSLMP